MRIVACSGGLGAADGAVGPANALLERILCGCILAGEYRRKAHYAVSAGLALAAGDRHLGAKLACAKTCRQGGDSVFTDGGRGFLGRCKLSVHHEKRNSLRSAGRS